MVNISNVIKKTINLLEINRYHDLYEIQLELEILKILLEEKSYSDKCQICLDNMNDISKIASTLCHCNVFYHTKCLFTAFQDPKQKNQCLLCRSQSSIYSSYEIIPKFLNPEEIGILIEKLLEYGRKQKAPLSYIQIINDFYLKINWKKLETIRNQSELLAVIDRIFIQVFDKKTTDVLKSYTSNPNFNIIIEDLYNLLDQNLSNNNQWQIISKHSPNLYILNNPISFPIIEETDFDTKFGEYTHNLFDNNFDWENIVMYGDVLYQTINKNLWNCPSYSNFIHLIIYGESDQSRKMTLKKILDYFEKKYGTDTFYVIREPKVYIFIRGFPQSIQIIYNIKNIISEFLMNIDFTHNQIFWINGTLYSTPKCLQSLITGITIQEKNTNSNNIKKANLYHPTLVLLRDKNLILNPKEFFKNSSVEELTPNNILLFNKLYEDIAGSFKKDGKKLTCIQEKILFQNYYPKNEETDNNILKKLQSIYDKGNNGKTLITKNKNQILKHCFLD